MADVKIEGIEELLRKLKKLPEKVQKNVLNGAIRAGAKPIIKEARRLVPVRTGNLKKSIGVNKRRTKNGVIHFSVSPRKGKNYDGWYGHFVEFGTKKSAPHPFMRPAYESKGKESIEAVRAYMRKRLEKELKKL